MLYLSTRSRTDTYTSNRALHEERAPDGGFYVPFQTMQFSNDELRSFKVRTFNENIAYILNIFFSCKLSAWDVEFCWGRYPARQVRLPHRLHIFELWHTVTLDYGHMEQALYSKLTDTDVQLPQNGWAKIAIEIAILFAIYGKTSTTDIGPSFDIAVEAKSFISPFAVWYARQMGLPVDTIVCGAYDQDDLWDLLRLGTMNTNVQINKLDGIERLIYYTLGLDEVLQYVSCCDHQRTYHIKSENTEALSANLFVAVISTDRLPSVVTNFYRSHGYVLDTVSAISFGALQDYRARTGESKNTLILSVVSPFKNASAMTSLLDISAAELEVAVNKQRG